MLKKYGWMALIAAFVLVFWLGQQSAKPDISHASTSSDRNTILHTQSPQNTQETTASSLPSFLPREALDTLELIARGGPFPYRQDGVAFQNREKRLPKKARGYYREYTVATPGLNHRGAKRIVTGGDPVEVYYYTDDHYDSFREFGGANE
jgi:ribonuclease T1